VHREADRKRDNEAAIVEANKASESTMKTIIQARQWPLLGRHNAGDLIKVLFNNALIPTYMMTPVRCTENTVGGWIAGTWKQHGGTRGRANARGRVGLCRGLCFTYCGINIVFLIEAHKAMP
jgi:hypothetical protein